jgi:hypothetical protein
MKSFIKIGLLAFLTFLASQVLASPISDGRFSTYEVSWVTSYMTVCSEVCKKEHAVAESMKLSSVSTQDMFVCRVLERRSNEYGSNTSDNCFYYDTSTSSPLKAKKFQCLCVKKSPGSKLPAVHPRLQ